MGIMSSFTESTGFSLPSFSNTTTYVLLFFGIILFGMIILLGFHLIWNKLKFNKKFPIFAKVGAKVQKVGDDLAMFQRVGSAGDYWAITKKSKKILPMPTIQMDKNEYWHYIREDGEFVNFGLQDLDEIMKKAGAYYVHEDMRLQRLGIQKNLRDRLQEQSWWQKHGTTLIFVVFMLLTVVLQIVQYKYAADTNVGAHEMAVSVKDMAIAVENLARGIGGGVVPA